MARRALSRNRLGKSFGYAWQGVRTTWRNEPNFRLECWLGLLAVSLAFWLEVSPVPVLLVSALVLAAELFNSALEATLDLTSPDLHPLAGRAKDAAAGAVFVAASSALLVGLWHLGPPLVERVAGWL